VHPLYDVYARLFRELFWLRYGAVERFVVEYRQEGQSKFGTVDVPAHVFAENEFHSYLPAGQSFAFKMLPGTGAGLLTINSFAPSAEFDTFLEQSFATLETQHAPALIIDVRRNGGGSGRLAQQVVSYLTDRPYKQIGAFYVKVTDDLKALYAKGTTHTDEDTRRIVMDNPSGALVDGLKDSGPVVITPPHRDHVFRGKVYVLTANNTFSAAAMFTAYVKCNQLGKTVGEEPGQTTNFVADAVPFTMPNSGLSFGVSFSEIHMTCEQSYYRGIQPDYPVTASRADIAQGKDVVLDYTANLIAKRK
jgi:C-terminal processing protease CtpA/Prc